MAPPVSPAGNDRRFRRLVRMVDWRTDGRRPAVCVEDLRAEARRRLPKMIFDHVDGGAGAETTLRANRSDFDRVTLRPRIFVPVDNVDTTATVCGQQLSLPVLLAPTGMPRLSRRIGELGVVGATARAGTIFTVSTASSYPLEQIAARADGPLWFQLYLGRDEAERRTLLSRVRDSGYRALVVTADVPAGGQRLRDLRNGLNIPPRITPRRAVETGLHPRWLWDIIHSPDVGFANFAVQAEASLDQRTFAERLYSPTSTWDDVARLRDVWEGTLIVKGVLTAESALLAQKAGADAVIVSNHGGRQLDGVPSAISALAEVHDAVGSTTEVLVDGGIRTGPDVVKALALGARAVLVGRPWVWGLAARGEAGVELCLEILREDLRRSMRLLGAPDLAALTRKTVTVPREWTS
jgi:isopentenyl diphosphate isomerase/L-lactate dehydrogenase-like FMN-dependent dehydrogenase